MDGEERAYVTHATEHVDLLLLSQSTSVNCPMILLCKACIMSSPSLQKVPHQHYNLWKTKLYYQGFYLTSHISSKFAEKSPEQQFEGNAATSAVIML